jgi:hypothetical protein
MGELFCLLLEALVGLGMSKNPLTWDSMTCQGIRAGLSVIVTFTPLSCIEYVPFTPLPEKLPDVVSPLKSTPYFLMPAALATKVLGRSVVFTQIVIDKLVSLSHPHCWLRKKSRKLHFEKTEEASTVLLKLSRAENCCPLPLFTGLPTETV